MSADVLQLSRYCKVSKALKTLLCLLHSPKTGTCQEQLPARRKVCSLELHLYPSSLCCGAVRSLSTRITPSYLLNYSGTSLGFLREVGAPPNESVVNQTLPFAGNLAYLTGHNRQTPWLAAIPALTVAGRTLKAKEKVSEDLAGVEKKLAEDTDCCCVSEHHILLLEVSRGGNSHQSETNLTKKDP